MSTAGAMQGWHTDNICEIMISALSDVGTDDIVRL